MATVAAADAAGSAARVPDEDGGPENPLGAAATDSERSYDAGSQVASLRVCTATTDSRECFAPDATMADVVVGNDPRALP